MTILPGYPPNIEEIKKTLHPNSNTVFTYGKTIYTQELGDELPDDLIAHEAVHSNRQGKKPQDWWNRYLSEPDFRLNEELAAYRAQYKFYLKHHARHEAFQLLMQLARDLSSEMYGNVIDGNKAYVLIKSIT